MVDLAQLEPAVPDKRDPVVPFAVVSSTVTSMDSAWGAAHWSPPTAPAPEAAPLPPIAPFPPLPGPVQPASGFPPPGTPEWFGPGPPYAQPPPAAVGYDSRSVLAAATPGLCICLGLGGLIYPLAPAMVVAAYFLSTRVKVAQRQVRHSVGISVGLLALVAVLTFLWNGAADSYWWEVLGGWAQIICWVLLATALLQVRSALKRRAGHALPPRYPSQWP